MKDLVGLPELHLSAPKSANADEPATGMVARVAWAIFRAGYHPDDTEEAVYELWKLFDQDRAMAYARARAAIDEMRECDNAMGEAGAALADEWWPQAAPFEMIYNVMIEAALGPPAAS